MNISVMSNLSQNYYARKHFFESDGVPTQSTIKRTMSPALAEVYFKSMTPKLKVLAGLDPPLKGGGKDWLMPPEDILQGRAVLKPMKCEYIQKLNYVGIDDIGMKLMEDYRKRMKQERKNRIYQSDEAWREKVETACLLESIHCTVEAESSNTAFLENAIRQFSKLYSPSLNKLQDLLFTAASKEIQTHQEKLFAKMQMYYQNLLEQQATTLYNKYTTALDERKQILKRKFFQDLKDCRTEYGNNLHDVTVEKHTAVERLRQYLECQNVACQVYVALKDRQECSVEIDLASKRHKKMSKKLSEDTAYKDFQIQLAKEKENEINRFNTVWRTKVCHVVKKFQTFVSYCLIQLPEQAEFFTNMEKLMLLQLNEVFDNPKADCIIAAEPDYHTPVAQPYPFYLFCDKRYKVAVDKNLCPKHVTSSTLKLPVIVINNQCIYAACDNFEQFTDYVQGYLRCKSENEPDFADYHDYSGNLPVQYTSSQQLLELKLESSLLQVLQQELANIHEVPTVSSYCEICHCCDYLNPTFERHPESMQQQDENALLPLIQSDNRITTRKAELEHEREPKWDSYMKYVKTKKCDCFKLAKKHLLENLPSYMRTMSEYDAPELPKYKTCSLTTLRALVKKANGRREAPPLQQKLPSKTDNSVQVTDQEFDELCTCFDDNSIERLYNKLVSRDITAPIAKNQLRVVGSSLSSVFLTKDSKSFASERALSLRKLIGQSSEVKELFTDCVFK